MFSRSLVQQKYEYVRGTGINAPMDVSHVRTRYTKYTTRYSSINRSVTLLPITRVLASIPGVLIPVAGPSITSYSPIIWGPGTRVLRYPV